MKRMFLFAAGILLITPSFAQTGSTSVARVQFFSEAPLENISAVNSSVASIINADNDSVFVRIKNTGFVFKNGLMQEHFNENYMESAEFPISSFRGKINPHFDPGTDGNYPVSATGTMLLHGVKKSVTIQGTISVKKQQVILNAEMMVKTADYNIEIPKLMFKKIAEEIKVTLTADYKFK